jgi:alkylation response protein AidB-like acyl-CoA dehydrogenase
VQFDLTEDQAAIRNSLRRFLQASGGPGLAFAASDPARAAGDETLPPRVWRGLVEELGLGAMLVAEEAGGIGLDHVALAGVMEELGRVVAPGPFLSTALGAIALGAAAASPAAGHWLPGIAEGRVTAAFGHEPHERGPHAGQPLRYGRAGGVLTLQGTVGAVIEGAAADLLVLAVDGPDGPTLVALAADTPGLTVTTLPTLDLTRRLAVVEATAVVADSDTWLAAPGPAGEALRADTLRRGAIALAAESLGGAQRCMDLSVDYARTRVQFGRVIGSFQSIAHKCADMLVKVETARSAVLHAAWAAQTGGDDLATVAALAKATAAEAYFRVAGSMIQVHGGIGFTWEHEAHLHFKRARSSLELLGSTAAHREAIAAMLLDVA